MRSFRGTAVGQTWWDGRDERDKQDRLRMLCWWWWWWCLVWLLLAWWLFARLLLLVWLAMVRGDVHRIAHTPIHERKSNKQQALKARNVHKSWPASYPAGQLPSNKPAAQKQGVALIDAACMQAHMHAHARALKTGMLTTHAHMHTHPYVHTQTSTHPHPPPTHTHTDTEARRK